MGGWRGEGLKFGRLPLLDRLVSKRVTRPATTRLTFVHLPTRRAYLSIPCLFVTPAKNYVALSSRATGELAYILPAPPRHHSISIPLHIRPRTFTLIDRKTRRPSLPKFASGSLLYIHREHFPANRSSSLYQYFQEVYSDT